MQEQSIFIEALEKDDPDQRAAFLDRVCGDDAALRQRIDKLLQRHQQADDFLERPAADLGVTVDQPPLSERPSPMIGPYKLLQPIGEGGMGVVWMAEQEQPVRRKVALKIIKPGMDSRQVIVRFEAERQALALMDHHNIARVFDADATESGRPHMARSPANLTILAGSLERVKLADTALRILQEGQHAYPADFCLNYQLGFLLYRRKDYAGAIRYCSVAVALRPDNAWAHRQLGAYLHGQGKFAEAEASYREAIRLEPDWAKPHDDLAWLLATCCDPKFRNYQQAVESAKRAVQLAPHEFSFWNTLGVAYRNGGKLDEAVAPFREAIRLKPDWPHAPYNLGIALRNQGKIAEAKATLREAIRLAPDWDLPHNDLA
jgi:Flp pilus assembly protein TadD